MQTSAVEETNRITGRRVPPHNCVRPGGVGSFDLPGYHGDTDSGCADVSNSNDDSSSGSGRSSKDMEPGN